jgi:cyclophilin family peptidyl-prolyl cis-trans isomerase
MIVRRSLEILSVALAGIGTAHATDVAVCTDGGRAVLELADMQAPQHVENFLRYVDMGYYSGTVFHRAVPKFVVQGGGVDRELRGRPTLPPVPNESSNGIDNVRGTVAAARTADPDSATSQFFVNLEDNPSLDAGTAPGYTVFGRVKEGIAIFDEIGKLPTAAKGPFRSDVPEPLVAIKWIARVDDAALAELPADDREAALKERILAAGTAGDPAATLRLVSHYRSLCGPDEPEIALVEAEASLALDDRRRAVFVLEEYFATTAATHPTYENATALYRRAVPENQQSAAQLVDDCTPPTVPTIPDGATAALEEMVAGQKQVRDFVGASESYLACLAKVIDNKERTPEDRNAAVNEHNRTVAAMEQAATAFNEQIRKFKARG